MVSNLILQICEVMSQINYLRLFCSIEEKSKCTIYYLHSIALPTMLNKPKDITSLIQFSTLANFFE